MKRIFLTIVFGLFLISQLYAQSGNPGYVPDTVAFEPSGHVPDVSTTVTSKEVESVEGSFQLDVTFNVSDSVRFNPDDITVYSQKPDTGSNFLSLAQNPLDANIKADTFTKSLV